MTFSATHEHPSHDRFVLGLPIRTCAKDAAKDIPAAWTKLMAEGWLEKMPRLDDDPAIYAVYTDYASDEHGPYTMVLGVAVAREAAVPPGLRRVCVPAGELAVFRVEGAPADVVWRAWAHVNGPWGARSRRRYVADFERYPLATFTEGAAVVEIAVGLSPR